ncbi:MAG: TetR/AcrR family transcriptional regulator [Clostridiales bacterium]|nr:TetR/AcrR family transcriptional regulator [Clostridiales bacterium]
MPKVTEAYKQEKRNMIVRSTWEIFEKKPLYDISMLDVVKKAGLSKGGIYFYYSDTDELLIDMINEILSSVDELSFSVDMQNDDVKSGLISAFRQLGDYMEACPSIIGKIRLELSIYMTNYPQKMKTMLPQIKLQQTGAQFMMLVTQLIQKGIEQKLFKNDLELDVILMKIMLYVDGMSDYVTRMKVYDGPMLEYPVSTYFEHYIKNQINSLLYLR